jgi:hypothetical protein
MSWELCGPGGHRLSGEEEVTCPLEDSPSSCRFLVPLLVTCPCSHPPSTQKQSSGSFPARCGWLSDPGVCLAFKARVLITTGKAVILEMRFQGPCFIRSGDSPTPAPP